MENVLKQQVLDLQADAMILTIWPATSFGCGWRRLGTCFGTAPDAGCHGTELARATAGTIRLKLLKVAARVTVSVRRVHVQLSSAYVLTDLFRLCHSRLMALAAPSG